MTNKKIKGKNAQINIIAKAFFDAEEHNICAAYLALLNMGVSKAKIRELDDDFYGDTVAQFRQDREDGVLSVYIDKFLQSVSLTEGDLKPIYDKHKKTLARAFCTRDSLNDAICAMRTDLVMLLFQIHSTLGYGNKRLKRVLSFMTDYKGDGKKAVREQLNISFPGEDVLPDANRLFEEQKMTARQKKRDVEAAAKLLMSQRTLV